MPPRHRLSAAFLLLVMVMLAYLPALRGDFIWDDDTHVSENEVLRAPDGLARIWTDRHSTCQYYPLTFTGFWLQYRLWGANPSGYHLVNIALHGVDALLLWWLLRRLRAPAAWWAAAVFALHPVNVMSVAWITELKNVLATLFIFLATGCFLASLGPDESDEPTPTAVGPRLALCFLLYVCALAAKTPAALTPVAWILILWWKQWRVGPIHVIFITLALLTGALAGSVTTGLEAAMLKDIPAFDLSYLERFLVFGRAFWFYLGKLAWPFNLMFFYPRWDIAPHALLSYIYPVAALAALAALWLLRRRIGRAPFAALAYFTLAAPAVVLVNLLYMTRFTWVTDHWQYFGMPAIVAWWVGGAARAAGRLGPGARRAARIGAGALLALLGTLTWKQCLTYRDIPTSYQATLARNPTSAIANYNLGVYYMKQADFARATPYFQAALRLEPDSTETLNNLALALASEGDLTNAIRYLEQGLGKSQSASMHYNMAYILLQQNRAPEAIAHFRQTLKLDPTFTDAYIKLAYLLLRDEPAEAVALYREALRRRPEFAPWLNGLAWILATHPDAQIRRPEEAIRLAEQACRQTSQTYAPYLDTLAAAYARAGRFAEAAHLAEVAQFSLPPDTPAAIRQEVAERQALFAAGQPFTQTNLAAFAAPAETRTVAPSPAVDLQHPAPP